MSALPAAFLDADLDLVLDLVEANDVAALDRLLPSNPKPEPTWLQRFHRRSDKSQSPSDFLAADRAKVSANSNRPSSPQPRGKQQVAGAGCIPTPVALLPPSHSPSSQPPVSRRSHRSNVPVKVGRSLSVRLHVPANQNRPPWARLAEPKKLSAIGAAAEAGNAYAVTAQMSARREAYLRAAAAAGRDIRQIVADYIARQFRRLGLPVPPFLFGIEISPRTSRLHIHGAFVPANHTPAYLAAVRDAFCHALGKIPGQSGSTQFDAEQLYDADRWRSYFTKDARRVRRELGLSRTLYVSRMMRQLGRDQYESIRKPVPAAPAQSANPLSATKQRVVQAPPAGAEALRDPEHSVALQVALQPRQALSL